MKVRQTLIGGSRKMIVHDDMEPTEKIKICDKGVTVSESSEKEHQMRIGRRAGDMWAPHIPNRKAVQTDRKSVV